MTSTAKILIFIFFGIAVVGTILWYTISAAIDNEFETSKTVFERKVSDKVVHCFATLSKTAQYPHSMDLKISGKINGSAIIAYGVKENIMNHGGDTVSNTFTFIGGGDWYGDTCFITYKPITATHGKIKVNCKIYSSKK